VCALGLAVLHDSEGLEAPLLIHPRAANLLQQLQPLLVLQQAGRARQGSQGNRCDLEQGQGANRARGKGSMQKMQCGKQPTSSPARPSARPPTHPPCQGDGFCNTGTPAWHPTPAHLHVCHLRDLALLHHVVWVGAREAGSLQQVGHLLLAAGRKDGREGKREGRWGAAQAGQQSIAHKCPAAAIKPTGFMDPKARGSPATPVQTHAVVITPSQPHPRKLT
jgi:hypothetical protein